MKDLRWRIEHAQHINAADIPRFGQLGVIASMQGIHATSDAPYVLARLGAERAEEGAYVWQKLMKSGAIVANGTDVPVERIDPMPNFYATITRKTKDGSVFYGDQKMSRAEALKSYTCNAAYAAKEEHAQGLARGGQARRHHRAVEGHHDGAEERDPGDEGGLHDRRRQGGVLEIVSVVGEVMMSGVNPSKPLKSLGSRSAQSPRLCSGYCLWASWLRLKAQSGL